MSHLAASVRTRLLSKAKEDKQDFSLVLTRYGLERLLYRLSVSSNKDNFLLQGALLFDIWFDVPLRPTRDIDLLGFGLAEVSLVYAVFEEICSIECDDGIEFDIGSIKISEIRKEANYAGLRVTFVGKLDNARCPGQIDVGYGDAVTPAPEHADYPVMLDDFPAPKLRIYPRYTVIAEKLQAVISLGMVNTRLKDYFDLWVLLNTQELDSNVLSDAIDATLARRRTAKPTATPIGLTESFGQDPQKIKQWQAFVRKNQLQAPELNAVVEFLRHKLVF